ncbi:MAG: hypothetical protein M1828_005773 [Chrysothrix sp. TS-e1954]|nr:MAG: hypothetical protein M1828_005773 [Chrysothrix sp. TS-e1954]
MPPADAGSGTPHVSRKSRPASTSASRVVPAIPHALGSKARAQRQPGPAEAALSTDLTREPSRLVTAAALNPPKPGKDLSLQEANDVTPVPETAAIVANGSLTPKTITNGLDTAEVKTDGEVYATEPQVPHVQAAQAPSSGEAAATASEVDDPAPILPPPFIPSSQASQDSRTATDSSVREPQVKVGKMDLNRPNTGNMVFGGNRDSASSSPAPPMTSAMPPNGVQSGYPIPYPGPQGFTPHNHGYHVSEPFAGPMYPSYGPYPPHSTHQQFGLENMNAMHGRYPRDYRQQQPRPYYPRRPEDMNFMPRYYQYQPAPPPRFPVYDNRPFTPTKTNESHSQQPKPMAPGSAASMGRNPRPEVAAPQHSLPLPGISANLAAPSYTISTSLDQKDADALAHHIRGQFRNRSYADCYLHLFYPGLNEPLQLPCHAIIISRSPRLRSLMTMQYGTSANQAIKTLDIPITDKFMVNELAITKAIAYLYADALPDLDFVSTIDASADHERARSHGMAFALAFAATGHFLQLDEVVSHGLQLAKSLLGWGSIEKALSFALEGGLSSSWLHQSEASTSEDRGSTSSFDDTPSKLDSPTSTPAYGFYSDRLLSNIMQFLIDSCPTDVAFLPSAPQLHEIARLPAIAENTHTRSSSRLNRIRFGDMTLEDEKTPDATATLMSSILVSLPFPALKFFFESQTLGSRLGLPKVGDLTREVIQEREVRRRRASDVKKSVANTSAAEERQWHNARWQEMVEPSQQQASGLKMSRQRLGAETPALSPRT